MIGASLSTRDRVEVLLSEYRALYALAEFRMGALDRRVPTAGAALLAFAGSVPVLPSVAQLMLLIAVPLSLIWLLRTAINHARSLEDLLRRIEQIELRVNTLAGDELLRFQSSHPSRLRAVGGRTGVETVLAVTLVALIVLVASGASAYQAASDAAWLPMYLGYLACVALYAGILLSRWTRYRYPTRVFTTRT